MSPYTQMMGGMRDLFEAMVLENTVDDEPDAPPIELQNDVDEEPTPPWEFYYTNKMWHGEGVPPPDVKNLISCSCKGVCDPRSKTCACLMNQRNVAADPYLEFAYDKAGRLKIPGYPVFECNDLCGCGDECRNRVGCDELMLRWRWDSMIFLKVVQHGRKVQVSIRKTEHKGWGALHTNPFIYVLADLNP
jgi:histone-lysine N-methyltransferase SUV39H